MKNTTDIFSATDALTALGRKERASLTLDDLLERDYRIDLESGIENGENEVKQISECERIFGKSYFPNLQEDLDLLTIKK